MSRILVVGYSAWDLIFPLAQTPAPDTKTEVSPMVTCGGGPAANAAVALAALGDRVRLLSVLSDDVFGRAQLAELERAGVDVSLVRNPARWIPPGWTQRIFCSATPTKRRRRLVWPPLPDVGGCRWCWTPDPCDLVSPT